MATRIPNLSVPPPGKESIDQGGRFGLSENGRIFLPLLVIDPGTCGIVASGPVTILTELFWL